MFWMPCRITQKPISTTISLAKYDFRKKVGRGTCPPYPPSFVGEPVTSLSDHEFLNYLRPTEHFLKSDGSFTSQNTSIWKSKDSINSSQITDRQSITWYLFYLLFKSLFLFIFPFLTKICTRAFPRRKSNYIIVGYLFHFFRNDTSVVWKRFWHY